ncbi:MAG: PEP-CTERM sorting domain-containing protein [Kiritimatiellia bacterium]
MKKIVVLVAAALVAVMSQAAIVDWTASGLSGFKSGTFYLFDSAKQSDVLAVLGAVDGTSAETLSGWALASGSVSTKGKASASATDIGDVTGVMAVVFAGDSLADGVAYKYIVEDVSSMVYTPPAGSPGNFLSTLATAGTAGTMVGGGSSGDIPEPTSGLLLLVGGAALALRRKQK